MDKGDRRVRISHVETIVIGTPWRNLTVVKVSTDEGLTGLGEVRMVGHTAALVGYLDEGAPRHVVGHDPFATEDLVRKLMRDDFARMGEIAMSGVAALEIACLDIKGQALGVPIYELLGGKVRDRIPAYANGWYTVERTPDEFHKAATAAVARGYRALKLDPFGSGFYELERAEKLRSISLVEAVRDAVGPDVEILVEMHGRFNPATAVEMAHALAPYRPGWFEEPVPPENPAALQKVSQALAPLGVPIAAGERIHTPHDYRELLERQAVDVIQVDITHYGGLLNAKKLAAWADAYYVLVAPHNVGGPVSTAAALHLAACTTNFKIQEHFNDFDEAYVKQSAPGNPEVTDGSFALPSDPGLGVTIDEEVILAHPRRHAHFNLFAQDWHKRGKE